MLSPNRKEYVIFSLVGRYRTDGSKQGTIQAGLENSASGGDVCSMQVKLSNQCLPMNIYERKFSPLMVVAIDFGSTFSGYSFVFTKDKSQVRYMRNGKDLLDGSHKVPYVYKVRHLSISNDLCHTHLLRTALLMDRNKKLHSFGYEAQSYFHELEPGRSDKWHYFENFKMSLHTDQCIDRNFKITSSNGKSHLDGLKVFSDSLKYLCTQAMQEISEQLAFELTKEDICWVVTVPALWNESAKQFMREVAIETGLVCPEMLHIALEPEAASLYCLHTYRAQSSKEECINLQELEMCRIEQETNYVVIDAGGGSVDLTFHQLLANQFVREVHRSSGLACGSFQINKAFEKMLACLLGTGQWQQFRQQCPSAYLDLMSKFELRKRETRLDRKNAYNIALPFGFIQHFAQINVSVEDKFNQASCPQGLKYVPKLGILRIEAHLMIQLFEQVIEPVKRHIKREINPLLEQQSIKYAFLVGGFAQSDVLRHKLKEALQPETLVVIPATPHLAVLNGAALFGLEPTIVQCRRAMRSYGIGVVAQLEPSLQAQLKPTTISKNGQQWCCGVLDRFVSVNQPVGLFESVTRRYRPVFEDQAFCLLHIYSTESEAVHLVTDSCVRKCGTIYLELQSDKTEGTLNPAIKQIMHREIEAQMYFGQTEIKVCVTDMHTGKLARANVDFLCK